jgi:hypothetical protein
MMSIKRAASLAATLLVALVLASPASASEGIADFGVTPSTTQAGGHPNLTMSISLESPGQPEAARDAIVNMPEGVFGNPNAIVRCSAVDFALTRCPSSSQAGLITIRANYLGEPNKLMGTAPIYDLAPAAGQTALFGFVVPILDLPVSIPVAVRTGSDYGLTFEVTELTQLAPLAGAQLTFWGFPAAAAHDQQRFAKGSPGAPAGCPGLADTTCISSPTATAINVRALTDAPSVCTGLPLTASLDVHTYQDPSHPSHEVASFPAVTGCYGMTFKPSLSANPTTSAADSPSGLDLKMTAPQPMSEATTPSPIRSASLTLPAGFTINPDAADGQSACSDGEASFGSEAPAACPDSAKIGTFTVGSPALDGPLEGSIYFGQPKPNDQYRLFLIADGFGIHAKLLGSVRPDPVTGQVTTVIDDLPQVPFEEFQLHLFASDRGLMATPTHCSLYEVDADFFPWNSVLADQSSSQFFSIDTGPNGSRCPGQERPFAPRLVAGTANPTAGAFSPFSLKLDRDDGDQLLGALNFTMPPGLTGSLRGISYCPQASILAASQNSGAAELATPSCPASSQVGTTSVAAGPGSHPFHASGRLYLAGPFKGAPLSLVAVTPALAGPFDYGVVVVRVAVHVDPLTAQVRAMSDAVPAVIGGIPIRLRSIQVNIDRPGFTLNPTNCSRFSVDSQGIGDQGAVAGFSSPFTAVNCAALPFKPKMTITQLGGRKATPRGRNPRLRVDLDTRPGDANLSSLALTLPKAFAVDQRHLGNICSRAQLAAEQCAGRQPIGEVEARTPLLDQPLRGPAYAVSGFGRLPHVIFVLDGQVTLLPEAESTSVRRGHLKVVVPTIPDAPIGHFSLTLLGGKQGYLINTRSLCGAAPAVVEFAAQNGRTLTRNVTAKAACPRHRSKHSTKE